MFLEGRGERFPWLAEAEANLSLHVIGVELSPISDLDLVENILVSWNWMLSPKLMLCSAMNNLSGLLQDMSVVLLNPGVDQVAWLVLCRLEHIHTGRCIPTHPILSHPQLAAGS